MLKNIDLKKIVLSAGRVALASAAIGLILVVVLHHTIKPVKIRISVPYGTPTIKVIDSLRKEGLIISRSALLFLFKITDTVDEIKAGVYEFNTKQTTFSIWRQLIKGETFKIKVTIPEGFTILQTAKVFEAKGIVDAKEFKEYAFKEGLEGYLFPETYFFEYFLTPKQVTGAMRREFERNYLPEFEEKRKKYNFTKMDHIVLASIIEKEARAKEEKPLVAAVFHNRLKKRMYIESCATIQYALGGWKKRLRYKDLKIESVYNTYTNFGLPPGPICNPGFDSLYAAVNPADSVALYFVADGRGSHNFYTRYSDHLKGREDLRKFRREWKRSNKGGNK